MNLGQVADINEFAPWQLTAPVGSKFAYYRGDLSAYRSENASLSFVADVAFAGLMAGKLTLFRKKNGKHDYTYFAQIIRQPLRRSFLDYLARLPEQKEKPSLKIMER